MFHAATTPEGAVRSQHRTPLPPTQVPASTTQEPSPAPTPVKPGRQRDPFFDNAKYLAIVLVSVGHFWGPLMGGSRTASALYLFVYAFHMPAFILVSGYFSRSFDLRPDRLRRLVTGVLVPYLVFEAAYTFYMRWVLGDSAHRLSLLDPWYLTWFLAALFVWRLTTPLWKSIRHPVPVALAISVLASVTPSIGDDFDLQRVLQFLPFFVIGLSLRPEHFQLVRRREVRLLSVPVLALALVAAYWLVPRMSEGWLYHSSSAQERGATWWTGIGMSLVLLACSMALVVCFLAWVPRRRTWFTVLGAGTVYGYLLHGFLAQGARSWGWYDPAWVHHPLGQILVTVLAAVAVTLMCLPQVRRVLRFAVEPRMAWAFRRDAAELSRERAKA
ncbi:acyltransferase family protein [Streptomyces sp. KLOTTS4A1]|uniref:acyltransferase family protein n=1 Tax=Streptomyces sp. KLOTTS4A1 TaxID=3390996 RepID=UPI0039F55CFD